MRKAFLLFFVVSTASALECPSGYYVPPNQNQTCFKPIAKGVYDDAQRQCRSIEDFIPMPKDETALARNAFIGLTCGTNSKDSCLWDSGEPLTYSNFAPGHPDMSIGPCVVQAGNGTWISADCTDVFWIVCQYIVDKKPPICPKGYDFFHGNCYENLVAPPNTDPNDACASTTVKSTLTSIHSQGENEYIFTRSPPQGFIYIGLEKNSAVGNYSWIDGTPFDYSNFEVEISGNCVAMDLGGAGHPSKWINYPCTWNDPSMVICKASAYTPSVVAPNCNGTTFLNGTVTFQSTGYPYPADGPADCNFLLSADPGQNITVTFTDTVLDAKATIKFYDVMFSKSPVATWTNMALNETSNRSFTSSSTFLKVVFVYNGTCPSDCTTKFSARNQWIG